MLAMIWKLMAAFPASNGVPFLTAEVGADTAEDALDFFQRDFAARMESALQQAGMEGATDVICAVFPPGYKAGDKAVLARRIAFVTLPK